MELSFAVALALLGIGIAIYAALKAAGNAAENEALRRRVDFLERTAARHAEADRRTLQHMPPSAASSAPPPTPTPAPPKSAPPSMPVHARVEETEPQTVERAPAPLELSDLELVEPSGEVEPAAAPPTSPPTSPPTAPSDKRSTLQRLLDRSDEEDARPVISWEEMLGTKGIVWIGAVALAFAGAFAVKWAYDKNFVDARFTMLIVALFGLGLIGGAHYLRKQAARIAAGLAGAGVAVLFAVILACVHQFKFFEPGVGFVLMVIVTIAAVLLSLGHGPFVALLGLVGGFATPIFMNTGTHNTPGLFSYLLVLEVGLIVVTHRKRWWLLSTLTLFFALAWAAVWIAFNFVAGDSAWIGLFLLGTSIAFVINALAATRPGEKTPSETLWPTAQRDLAWVGVIFSLALTGWLAHAADYTNLEWAFLGLIGAGCMVLARFDMRYTPLPALAAAFALIMLIMWRLFGVAPLELKRMVVITASFGLLFGGGSYGLLWRSAKPAMWATLSAATSLAFFLFAYFVWRDHTPVSAWTIACVVLAAVFVVAATPIYRSRATMTQGNEALAALAVAASAFIALAAPIALERQWITVAWALLLPAVVAIELWLDVRTLRKVAAALAVLVAARLLLNPAVLEYPIGTLPILNWLLYGYGLPAACFAFAAWLYHRAERQTHATAATDSTESPDPGNWLIEPLQVGAMLIAFALVSLQVRHVFHRAALGEPGYRFAELGTYAVAWLVAAVALLLASRRCTNRLLQPAGIVAAGLALLLALVGAGVVANPIATHEAVGSLPFLNTLLYVYGLPALLGVIVARLLARRGEIHIATAFAIAALVLVGFYVTFAVRHIHHRDDLGIGAVSNQEMYSYSAAWIILGVLLLASGIAFRGLVLRWASLVVILAATGKVFLIDTAHLEGLYKVASFLGLGVTLMAVAFVYQRFVFRDVKNGLNHEEHREHQEDQEQANEPQA